MTRDPFHISTDKSKLDLNMIHGFLSHSYWSQGIPRETVARAIEHSLCFGIYENTQGGDRQIGFARVVTDYAAIAYLGDVFILESYRGRDLSKRLMESIMAHPDLQGMRRWILGTRDAHGLYEKFGFTGLKVPERFMEIHNPNVYTEGNQANQEGAL